LVRSDRTMARAEPATARVGTAAERLSAFALGLEWNDLPPPVTAAAKLHLLDTIGCGLAARALGIGDEPARMVAEQGGHAESTVIGNPQRVPAASAALANGVLCHRLDYDDTHAAAGTHVSVTVLPAALAAAEAAGATGRDLLLALVAGSEIAVRIGLAAPFEFHRRGFHPTSVCAIFGATAAAGRLQGLSPVELTNALGLAGSMASGLFEYLADGSATKPLHPGWAAHGAVEAARLARLGMTGPKTVFEGRFGLFAAYLGRTGSGLEEQLDDLGRRWETAGIAFKPYPACHFSHATLDAVRLLMTRHGLRAADIAEAVATVPEAAVPLVLEPVAAKLEPRSDYDAKFSLQFSIGAMLVDGAVGIDTFTERRIRDPQVLAVARRVGYEVKDYGAYPDTFPGGVRIVTTDGRRLAADVPQQRGGTANPMSEADVRDKFTANARLALPAEEASTLEAAILRLDEETDLASAFSALGSAAKQSMSGPG
jgi:2-methylcitrate dehydratase PrpD